MTEELINRAKKYATPFAILKLKVPDHLKLKYMEAIESHNRNMEKNYYFDSGFDLFLPDDYIFTTNKGKIDFEVKCEMITYESLEEHKSNINEVRPTGYFLFPRSSISKKPLMLANSVGLIDSGYRGNIMAVFRYFPEEHEKLRYKLEKYERLIQIVHPCTYRIFVELVEELTNSERGNGGFGSTG